MRMEDLSLLAFNEEPGPLARESLEEGTSRIDPLFLDLVQSWPANQSGILNNKFNVPSIRLIHPLEP